MKYNYYILTGITDYYKQIFSDLSHRDDVVIVNSTHELLGNLYIPWRIQTGRDFNKYVRIPFKNIWNKTYLKKTNLFKDKTKPICFVLSSIWTNFALEQGFIETIRKEYPSAKVVWLIADIISKQKPLYPKEYNKNIFPDMDEAKKIFDLIISYDHGDCKKYGLVYHALPFSSFSEPDDQLPNSDVFFLGRAKDRLNDIITIFEYLRSKNLKLDFYITGVSEDEKIYADEIHYNTSMSYQDNLRRVLNTKCILEVMQKGASGYTLRANEAVCLGRKLLTNNQMIEKLPFFDEKYISTFSIEEGNLNVDEDFIDHISDVICVDFQKKSMFSPIKFLKFIEERL